MDKVIALDIGGVCMHLRHDLCIQTLGWEDKEIPVDIWAGVNKFESGNISEVDFLALIQQKTGQAFSDQELISHWNLVLGDTIEGMEEVVQEICQMGYRFIFFSDTSNIHLLEIWRKLTFAHLVSGGIYSFEVGALKPDRKMYDAFELQYGKPCFYIDDKHCNIEGGKAHGWTSHQFTTPETFRKAFFEAEKLG